MPPTITSKETDELLRRGIRLLETSHLEEAATLFEAALSLERKNGSEPPPRLLSYCGYTMAFARKKYMDGLQLCKTAVEKEFYNPDLFYNLGEIYLARGDKKNAHAAFTRGLALAPEHAKIRARMKEMGVRRSPVLSFLDRDNVLNRFLGALFRPDDGD
jgi:tetratricopeptide (TPR) repeat protein